MVVQLVRVDTDDRWYQSVEKLFKGGWVHTDKTARIQGIYLATPEPTTNHFRPESFIGRMKDHFNRWSDYARRVQKYTQEDPGMRFHGTRRACHIGDDDNCLKPCTSDACYLCNILRRSFKLKSAGGKSMLGPGIYTTTSSSKADNYSRNHHVRSKRHALLLCSVVTGNVEQLYFPNQDRASPSSGYHCVEAVTRDRGGSVNFPETVVYREDAILPWGLVMYTRKGWQP